jgi:hypothetical protein
MKPQSSLYTQFNSYGATRMKKKRKKKNRRSSLPQLGPCVVSFPHLPVAAQPTRCVAAPWPSRRCRNIEKDEAMCRRSLALASCRSIGKDEAAAAGHARADLATARGEGRPRGCRHWGSCRHHRPGDDAAATVVDGEGAAATTADEERSSRRPLPPMGKEDGGRPASGRGRGHSAPSSGRSLVVVPDPRGEDRRGRRRG